MRREPQRGGRKDTPAPLANGHGRYTTVTPERTLFSVGGMPGVFCACSYSHAYRLRLEKLLYLELFRSPSGFFLVLQDPGGSFTSETAARRF
jgi:hypothetical protein